MLEESACGSNVITGDKCSDVKETPCNLESAGSRAQGGKPNDPHITSALKPTRLCQLGKINELHGNI